MKNARVRVRVRVNASASASASTSAFLDRLTPSLRHFGEATRSFLQEAVSVPGRLKRSAEQHRELGRPSRNQYISIYISSNSFPGWVDRQEKPWRPATFCKGHRGIVSFSGKIFNTIEKVTPHFAKVTRFLGPLATPAGPSRDLPGSAVNNGTGDPGPALPLAK